MCGQIPLTLCGDSGGWDCEDDFFECSCRPASDDLTDREYKTLNGGCSRLPVGSRHNVNDGVLQNLLDLESSDECTDDAFQARFPCYILWMLSHWQC